MWYSEGSGKLIQGDGGKVQNMDPLCGPGPWNGSMDRVHQNMDRVQGPPFMDWAHGLPTFSTPKNTESTIIGKK